jgi:hypothetical protein
MVGIKMSASNIGVKYRHIKMPSHQNAVTNAPGIAQPSIDRPPRRPRQPLRDRRFAALREFLVIPGRRLVRLTAG